MDFIEVPVPEGKRATGFVWNNTQTKLTLWLEDAPKRAGRKPGSKTATAKPVRRRRRRTIKK